MAAPHETLTKAARKSAAKRKLIDTGTNKLYVRRNARGTSFKEVDDVGRSLSADRRRKAKTVARRGQGDKGDRHRQVARSRRTSDQRFWSLFSTPRMWRPTISAWPIIPWRCWLALMASRKRRSNGAEFRMAVVPDAR